MKTRRIAALSISVTLVACVVAWRAWSGPSPLAFDGTVHDEKTGRPLQGVFVIVQWMNTGGGLVDARTTCAELYVTQTDAAGRYHVPTYWPAISPFVERYIRVFRIGYEDAFPPQGMSLADYERYIRNWPMREFTGTGDERLAQHGWSGYLTVCGRDRARAYHMLLPLERALNQDARTLQVSPENQSKLEGTIGFLSAFEAEMDRAERGFMK